MAETVKGKRKMLYITPDPAARQRAREWDESVVTPQGEYPNMKEFYRPELRPGERMNLRDEPDNANTYARGGVIRAPSFAKGGPVLNSKSYAKGK